MDSRGIVPILLVVLLLLGLPVAVWLDLHGATRAALFRQAHDLNAAIESVRAYYTRAVIGRVLAFPGSTKVVHNYESVPGAIPIPSTLSLELGGVIGEQQHNISYRFISDYPFINRAPHAFDAFETEALKTLRANPSEPVIDVSRYLFSERVRLAAPVVMSEACVACHNSHVESPKHDWKVGDVRGLQEVSITQSIAFNVLTLKYLLLYFFVVAAIGVTFITQQRRQAAIIRGMNVELQTAKEFFESLSRKISYYLSPQVYKSIFSGEKDTKIYTERKKLTIFFSDIKDFTARAERLQPEQITQLLNEYFTEMSNIALRHGGTIDKFIGDAMLIFFGDPESKSEVEDAKACMRMAFDMRRRIAELNMKWRNAGIEEPFRVRMGINTGFCNVGNFGSADRMDYTIIGAEANLAARLQSIAEPGRVVISYETYALVRDIVVAQLLPPISMKGISREVAPYEVKGMLDSAGAAVELFSAHMTGLDLYLDPSALDKASAESIRLLLQNAIKALESKSGPSGPDDPA